MTMAAALLLNELMGRDRDLAPGQSANKMHWSDPEVCKYYLCGFCPSELFTNTKADLGPCDKEHDDFQKAQYRDSARFGKMGYEEDYQRYLLHIHNDIQRKIQRGHDRLKMSQQHILEQNGGQVPETEQMKMLSDHINQLCEEVETLGSEGKVEEAQGVAKLVEQLKEEREQAKSSVMLMGLPGQEKQMEVCEICAAFLIVGDAQSRVDDHLQGKQHLGYARIKNMLDEMKDKPWLKAIEEKRAEEKKAEEKKREDKKREEKEKEEKKRKEKEEKRKEEKLKEESRSSRDDRDKRDDRRRDDRDKDRKDSRDDRGDKERSSRDGDRERRRSREKETSRRSRDRDTGSSRKREKSRDRDSRRDRDRSDRDKERSSHRDRSRERSRRSRSRDKKRSKDKDAEQKELSKRSDSKEKSSRKSRSRSRDRSDRKRRDRSRDRKSRERSSERSSDKKRRSSEKESGNKGGGERSEKRDRKSSEKEHTAPDGVIKEDGSNEEDRLETVKEEADQASEPATNQDMDTTEVETGTDIVTDTDAKEETNTEEATNSATNADLNKSNASAPIENDAVNASMESRDMHRSLDAGHVSENEGKATADDDRDPSSVQPWS